jgi:AcrR family transcriptional regulator
VPSEDPRIARTRAAVLGATIKVIGSDGLEAVTFQEVARRAGVGRATVYRHWPHPDELIFEALAEIVSEWDFAGPGRLRDNLVDVIGARRSELNQPLVRIAFNAVLSRAPRDPSAAAIRDRLVGGIVASLEPSVAQGVERGELRTGIDAELIAAQVMGAMVWRSFVLGSDVTRRYIEDVVEAAIGPWEVVSRH